MVTPTGFKWKFIFRQTLDSAQGSWGWGWGRAGTARAGTKGMLNSRLKDIRMASSVLYPLTQTGLGLHCWCCCIVGAAASLVLPFPHCHREQDPTCADPRLVRDPQVCKVRFYPFFFLVVVSFSQGILLPCAAWKTERRRLRDRSCGRGGEERVQSLQSWG